MTTLEIIAYYSGLLIKQYNGLPKAQATIEAFVNGVVMPQVSTQTITFTPAPASGAFTLEYDSVATTSLNWNDNAATIQAALRLLSGLSSITVTGSIAAGLLVTFTGVTPPALLLTEGANSLVGSGEQVVIEILETDLSIPLAVQDAFNLLGDNTAVGAQLDILGKYAGVTRNCTDLSGGFLTLDDTDFLQLIRMAIITNNAGSSLETIQDFLEQFFPDQVLVTDYQTMRLSYLMSTTIGSTDLVQALLAEGLLPKPMGVGLSVAIVPDVTKLFAFRTYQKAMPLGKPFNRYGAFDLTWRWLSYADII